MANKFRKTSLFESGFDSFEFDDGFLMRLDSDLKKNKINEKQSDIKKSNPKTIDTQDCTDEKSDKKISQKKTDYYDLPLFIEDLEESDLFESVICKKKKHSPKVVSNHKNEQSRKASLTNNFISCLSPIQGPKSTVQMNLSSSTPVKSISESNSQKKTSAENSVKNFDYVNFEADLFDDWDINTIKTQDASKSMVTFSQAMRLIEEAESAKGSDEKASLNQSVDLLTGEIVGTDLGVMFEESFDVPESKKQEDLNSSSDSVIIVAESNSLHKPSAAQKLNFESDKANSAADKNRSVHIFSSDDDFDFHTQDLIEKSKEVSKFPKSNPQSSAAKSAKLFKECDPNNSNDAIMRIRKGRCFKVIESDTTEDSPSPKFRRQNKTKKRKNCQKNLGKEFLDSEAEVSDEVEVSSDEADEDGDYEKSFLDEDSYFTQNCSANMTSKYLESVKGLSVPGSFKIPESKPYNPDNVFSQIPEENEADYEIDSFCVNDVEEAKTDLSDLEVAEKILEMNRKKKKRKRWQKIRK